MILVSTSKEFIAIDGDEIITIHKGAGPYYGITVMNGHVYVGARNKDNFKWITTLEVFDISLNHVESRELPEVFNIHQIDSYNGEIYIANTNKDRIEKCDGSHIKWTEQSGDRHHINSVLPVEEGIYVCEHNHGKGKELGKKSSVKLISYEGEVLKDIEVGYGIHSLLQEESLLYVCDSFDMNLVGIDLETGSLNSCPVRLEDKWYLRGLARMDKDLLIGLSWLGARDARHGDVEGGIAVVGFKGVKDIISLSGKGQVNEIRVLEI
jgi:hypothetical protein